MSIVIGRVFVHELVGIIHMIVVFFSTVIQFILNLRPPAYNIQDSLACCCMGYIIAVLLVDLFKHLRSRSTHCTDAEGWPWSSCD
jgi:hypothetical protein